MILIFSVMILVTGCSLHNGFSDASDRANKNSVYESQNETNFSIETQTEKETEDYLANKTVDDYVSTVREFEWNDNMGLLLAGGKDNGSDITVCRLPELSTDLKASSSINREICEEYESWFDEYINLEDQFLPVDWIDYRCYLNSSLLSLVIEERTTNNYNSFFKVYNIDVLTGEKLSKNEVLSRSTVSADVACALVKSEIEKIYSDIDQDWVTNEMMADAYSFIPSEVDEADFYFNEDGILSATYRYRWFAGSGEYGNICVLDAKIKD